MKRQLWLNGDGSRYFVIHHRAIFEAGEFVVRALDGREMAVDEEAVEIFEVTAAEARLFVRTELGRAVDALRESLPNAEDDSASHDAASKAPRLDDSELRDWLAQLPEIADNLLASLSAMDGPELARLLKQTGDLADASPDECAARLDELAQRLERYFDTLIGQDPERAGRERRQRHRNAARRAITASLRRHGIQPLVHPGETHEP